MKNKLGFLLIILSIILIISKYKKDNINTIYQNKIISNIYDNHNIYKEYKGYIKIPKYNIKKVIKKGTSDKILDQNYVGIMNINKPNLIILAGHNTNSVFKKIHYMKKNDLIELYLEEKEIYIVEETKEIRIDDYKILNDSYNTKTLILITCTNNRNKRFIVIAKKYQL